MEFLVRIVEKGRGEERGGGRREEEEGREKRGEEGGGEEGREEGGEERGEERGEEGRKERRKEGGEERREGRDHCCYPEQILQSEGLIPLRVPFAQSFKVPCN